MYVMGRNMFRMKSLNFIVLKLLGFDNESLNMMGNGVVMCFSSLIHVPYDMICFGIVGGQNLGFGICCMAEK